MASRIYSVGIRLDYVVSSLVIDRCPFIFPGSFRRRLHSHVALCRWKCVIRCREMVNISEPMRCSSRALQWTNIKRSTCWDDHGSKEISLSNTSPTFERYASSYPRRGLSRRLLLVLFHGDEFQLAVCAPVCIILPVGRSHWVRVRSSYVPNSRSWQFFFVDQVDFHCCWSLDWPVMFVFYQLMLF